MYLVRDLYVYEYKVINEDDAKKAANNIFFNTIMNIVDYNYNCPYNLNL